MELKFKTNIKCSGCVAKVAPFLEQEASVEAWNVDTGNPDKILTVTTHETGGEKIMETVKRSGFSIEQI